MGPDDLIGQRVTIPLSNASTLDQNIERAIERDSHLNPDEVWARFVAQTQIAFEMMREYAFRVLEAFELSDPDQGALDSAPDLCWRCNAKESADDLGLCEPCRADLVDGRNDL